MSPPGSAAQVDRSTAPPGELLALLTDEHAREILEAIRDSAEPARVLAERCDASRATVYRRLARLREAGLVEAEMTYDDDGHHRETFRAAVERVRFDLGADGFEAELAATDRRRATGRNHHSP